MGNLHGLPTAHFCTPAKQAVKVTAVFDNVSKKHVKSNGESLLNKQQGVKHCFVGLCWCCLRCLHGPPGYL